MMRFTEYRVLKKYFSSVFKSDAQKIVLSQIITVFLGLTKGGSLLMLLPLLSMAGVTESPTQNSKAFELARAVWELLGISFTLYSSLVLYLLLVGFYASLGYFRTILDTEIVQTYKQNLRNDLFSSVIRAEWGFIKNARSSHIFNNIITEVDTLAYTSQLFITSMGTAVMFCLYVAISLYVSFIMTLIASLCFIPLFFFQKKYNKQSYATGNAMYERHQSLYSAVLEFINSFKLAKSYNFQDRYESQFRDISRQTYHDNHQFSKIRASTSILFELGSALIICIILIWAIQVLKMPVVDLLLMVYIATRLLPNISTLTRNLQYILNALPSYTGVTRLMEEARQKKEKNNGVAPLVNFPTKSITFSGIRFSYGDAPPIFDNFDCTIPFNETTSIVGESGKGKSTLVEMLLGLLKPQEGKILLDGVDLYDFNLVDWRNGIAYIPQECFLFHATIRQNLLWAKPDASEEELKEALRSSAGEFVFALPNGLETIVGDQGVRLSGGERQRIALARALLRKPKILILDEATNALDRENEALIKVAIDRLKGKTTVILISHDQTLTEGADQVIYLA